mmetsp:Transcript_11249/g.48007  ORF Transcript_11249/g.48007 Transcript_11249/m.48007 type:complete len:459 (-) Transcript_11249:5268-6644(-)
MRVYRTKNREKGRASAAKRAYIFFAIAFVFVLRIGLILTVRSDREQVSVEGEIHFGEIGWDDDSLDICACLHPGDTAPGKNGYICKNSSLNGFCPSHLECASGLKAPWRYGDFPCVAKAICECIEPGNTRNNGFTCSNRDYDGECEKGLACLTPSGRVWNINTPPCGTDYQRRVMTMFGAFDQISIQSSCMRTMASVDPVNVHSCKAYEETNLLVPDCSRRKSIVPHVLHSIDRSKSSHILSMVLAVNPTFKLNRHDDSTAFAYIGERCGTDAAKAFSCLIAPSFRADLFRFCALYHDGGIYLDSDIVPMKPLSQIVSMCSSATIGHDFPSDGTPAKQMKILAAAPKSKLMKCALDDIVRNVRNSERPKSPLGLTGPLMLQRCYEKHSDDVAISYIDTRNALWPFSGMRAGDEILAYEFPKSVKSFCRGTTCTDQNDYASLYKTGNTFRSDCELHHEQ